MCRAIDQREYGASGGPADQRRAVLGAQRVGHEHGWTAARRGPWRDQAGPCICPPALVDRE